MSVGRKLLASLIDSKDGMDLYVKHRLIPELFAGPEELQLFQTVDDYVRNFGQLPNRGTLMELGAPVLHAAEEVTEPPKYYLERCKSRHIFHRLKLMLKDVEGSLNNDQPYEALDRVLESLRLCQIFAARDRLFDMRTEALPIFKHEFVSEATLAKKRLWFGWPTLDEMTGGMRGGDLITIVGRPGMGKTYCMLYAALESWADGHSPLFVSMEMNPVDITQRTAAITTSNPIYWIRSGQLPVPEYTSILEHLKQWEYNEIPFWLLNANLNGSVDELLLLCQQLKPSVVFVDGAYMLDRKYDAHHGDADNAKQLKQKIAADLDIPVVISYQYNRKVSKKTKAREAGLEDIAYTDAIGQLSSVVLGLLQEEGVETLIRRRVEILKGRNGEQGSFEINWNFNLGPNFMDFSEAPAFSGELVYV